MKSTLSQDLISVPEKTVFVISPIGKEGSPTRVRSDKILNYFIKPICEDFGYNIIRSDNISEPGIITSQIIEHILNDAIIFADLTNHNPNVFYELAICHAFQRPVIQIIKNGQEIPFDISPTRVIKFNDDDPISWEEAQLKIKNMIKLIKEKPEKYAVESPISIVASLKNLQIEEGNEIANIIKDLVERIAYLSNEQKKIINLINRLKKDESSRFRYVQNAIISGHYTPSTILSKYGQISNLAEDILGCDRCELYRDRQYPVIGEGNLDAEVVFIGDTPERYDDETGRPFVGPAGNILDQLLEKIGLNRGDVFITNIVRCRPISKDKISSDEIEKCFSHLLKQLTIIKPSIIATMGSLTTKSILEKFGIKIDNFDDMRGKKYRVESSWGPVIVVPLYHTKTAINRKELMRDLENDFTVIKQLLDEV